MRAKAFYHPRLPSNITLRLCLASDDEVTWLEDLTLSLLLSLLSSLGVGGEDRERKQE